jgi:hypothetical protein
MDHYGSSQPPDTVREVYMVVRKWLLTLERQLAQADVAPWPREIEAMKRFVEEMEEMHPEWRGGAPGPG